MEFKSFIKLCCLFLFVSLNVNSIERNEHPPKADAGFDQFARLNQVIRLNASNSTDKDGNRLVYNWRVINKPENSDSTILDSSNVTAKLKIDQPGSYEIELLVSDGESPSSVDSLLIDTNDTTPQLPKLHNQKVIHGESAFVDGSNIKDPDGDDITFDWRLESKPQKSNASIQDSDTKSPIIATDAQGKYSVRLHVSDHETNKTSNLFNIFAVASFDKTNRALGCVLDRIFFDSFDGLFNNSAPIADVGSDKVGVIGQVIALDGSLSSDIDMDSLTYSWSLLTSPVGSSVTIDNNNQMVASLSPDVTGDYVAQLIVNDGCLDSDPDSALVTISINQAPQITSSPDTSVRESQAYSYQVIASDPEGHELNYELTVSPAGSDIDDNGMISWTSLSEGFYPVTVLVTDEYGATDSQSYDIAVIANSAPIIQSFPLSSAEQDYDYSYQLVVTDADNDSITYQLINPLSGMTVDTDGLITWSPNAAGSYQVEVQVGDGFGGTDTQVFTLEVIQLPPNPADIAPPLSRTDFPPFIETINFLYDAEPPVQIGLVDGTIKENRASVLGGKVLDAEGNPLAGVKISINNKPEYGYTYSRLDGLFDLVVNGGGIDVVHYSKGGYLDVQRGVKSEWNSYHFSDDVVLIRLDSKVTNLDLSDSNLGYQIAQGSLVSDEDGDRQTTLMFPPSTTATMILPDGSIEELDNINVRSTEYTVGPNGVNRMPADLPAFSAYTYATELSLDEAIFSGAERVDFNQPLPMYFDNFLDFPAGVVVPVGWYDKNKSVWVPSDNGLVVKIIRIENSSAVLDVTNDDIENDATQAELDNLNITTEELIQLAALYSAGKSLWRSPITHFTPWDCNFPYVPPDDIQEPPEPPEITPPEVQEQEPTDEDPETDDNDEDCEGCVINAHNRTLEESIPIIGTNYQLHYRSNPNSGIENNSALDSYLIEVSGPSIPASLKRIELTITNHTTQGLTKLIFSPEPNQSFNLEWDGKDKYGRLAHSINFDIKLRYVFPGRYVANLTDFDRLFGILEQRGIDSFAQLDASRDGNEIGTFWKREIKMFRRFVPDIASLPRSNGEQKELENIAEEQLQLGGWTLEEQHVYNPNAQILYQGDGFIRKVNTVQAQIDNPLIGGNGGPAINGFVEEPSEVEISPNGDILIADSGLGQIRRITPDGTILRVAGKIHVSPPFPFCNEAPVEGETALEMCLDNIEALAVAPDGSIYVAYNRRIRKIDASTGTVNTIAGTGSYGTSPDGTPAIDAEFIRVNDMKLDKNNTLYFLEDRGVLRIIDSEGNLQTIAGGGFADPFDPDFSFSNKPATEAGLFNPDSFTIAEDGNIVIADTDHECLRQVTPDGFIYTVSGSADCYVTTDERRGLGEGGVSSPRSVKFDNEGALVYIDTRFDSDLGQSIVEFKKILPYGMTQTLSSNPRGYSGDDGSFELAQFDNPSDMEFDKEGNLIIADTSNNRVRKVSVNKNLLSLTGDGSFELSAQQSTLSYSNQEFNRGLSITTNAIASRNGKHLYLFSDEGVHLKTIDAITAKVLREFTYDQNGLLSQIKDGDGLITIINRDAEGTAQSIQSPYGKITQLEYDFNGKLQFVTDPLLNKWEMEYTDGLLSAFIDREENRSEFSYDQFGLIQNDLNAIGGGWTLSNTSIPGARQVTMTSGEGRTYEFIKDKTKPNIEEIIYETTNPDGTKIIRSHSVNTDTVTMSDGTVNRARPTGTSRLGNQVKFNFLTSTKISSGLNLQASHQLEETVSSPGVIFPVLESKRTTIVNEKEWIKKYAADIGDFGGYEFTSPENRTRSLELDINNKTKRASVADFHSTNIEYDSQGRVSRAYKGSGPELREYTFTYYGSGVMEGELHTVTNPLQEVFSFEYDANGQTTKQILPDLSEVLYSYDANGNLISLTPPNRPTHFFEYDGKNNETSYKAPTLAGLNSNEIVYEYNSDGQIVKKIKPDGNEIIFNYDSVTGLPSTTQVTEGVYTYVYSATTGLIETATSADGVILDFAFDSFLPISSSYSGVLTGDISRTFDNLFRVTSTSVNGSNTITFEYDDDNYISKAGDLVVNLNPVRGVIDGTNLDNVITSRAYDDFANIESYDSSFSGTSIYSYNLVRDKLSRIVSKTETINGVTNVFEYDFNSTGQLVEEKTNGVVTSTWNYDSNTNRTHLNGSLISTFDDQDRMLTYEASTFTYTDNGELATYDNGSTVTTYQHDSFGSLSSVTDSNGLDISYLYDSLARRVAKIKNGVISKSWIYKDGLNPIAELDSAGVVVSRFVYGDKDNVPSYMIKNGETYRIISNHLGSPILVVNTLTGFVAQELAYDVWGNVLSDSNPEFQPFGFAGGIYDVDTRLTNFGYRDYAASFGRWTSKDPIGFASSYENLYVYLNNEPTSSYDEYGLRNPRPIRPNNSGYSNQNRHLNERWERREQNRMDNRRERINTENTNRKNKFETFVDALEDLVTNGCKIAGTCIKDQYAGLCIAWKCGGTTSPENFNQNIQCTANGTNFNDNSFYFGEHDQAVPMMTGPNGFDLNKNNCRCINFVHLR